MTPEPASGNAAPPLGEAGRITGVYFDPKTAFADIVARPGWIVPVVLLIIAGLAATYTIGARVGWDRSMRSMMESNTRMQQLDPQQRETALQQQVKFAPIAGYVFTVIGVPIGALIVGGVILLMSKLGGASLKFKQTFAISAYAMLPKFIASILLIVVLFLKNPDEFNLQNPLAFNIAAFLTPPPVTGKFVYSLATSFDLFTIWTILLLAVGISVDSRKLPFSKAVVLVAAPWLVWVLVASGFAGMFS